METKNGTETILKTCEKLPAKKFTQKQQGALYALRLLDADPASITVPYERLVAMFLSSDKMDAARRAWIRGAVETLLFRGENRAAAEARFVGYSLNKSPTLDPDELREKWIKEQTNFLKAFSRSKRLDAARLKSIEDCPWDGRSEFTEGSMPAEETAGIDETERVLNEPAGPSPWAIEGD